MKLSIMLVIVISLFLVTACGNKAENGTANSDTTVSSSVQPEISTQTPQDTAKSGADLMKPMNDMMVKMQSMQMTGDFNVDFANMMIEHHQGGIDMAQVEVSDGKDEKMKTKAQEILTMQKEEQQQLRDFVSSYKSSGMKHGEGELQKSMSTMNDKMKSMQMSGDVDKDFALMMSSHHEDGISMEKMELKNGMSDKLKQMSQKSITSQQKDIKKLKALLSGSLK